MKVLRSFLFATITFNALTRFLNAQYDFCSYCDDINYDDPACDTECDFLTNSYCDYCDLSDPQCVNQCGFDTSAVSFDAQQANFNVTDASNTTNADPTVSETSGVATNNGDDGSGDPSSSSSNRFRRRRRRQPQRQRRRMRKRQPSYSWSYDHDSSRYWGRGSSNDPTWDGSNNPTWDGSNNPTWDGSNDPTWDGSNDPTWDGFWDDGSYWDGGSSYPSRRKTNWNTNKNYFYSYPSYSFWPGYSGSSNRFGQRNENVETIVRLKNAPRTAGTTTTTRRTTGGTSASGRSNSGSSSGGPLDDLPTLGSLPSLG